jgi:phytoene synthase
MTGVAHQLDTAYSICRHIARSAAKNFYYGFMVLPRHKRNAMSAVYAFMRHADDICDAPGMTVSERRAKLYEWLESYHRVADGASTDDPVFLALRDSQQQFNIPLELLDKLVRGTGMDLQYPVEAGAAPARASAPADAGATTAPAGDLAASPQAMVAYATFEDLYEYCYHVASVVGLVCIRIFGYRNRDAEPLAEHVGIAFQLTNILRDIKEDAEMGRIYIPEEDLRKFGIAPAELASGSDLERLRPLLHMQAQRARKFYAAADQLIPLIDGDAQPALAVLVEIYSRLLERIEQRNYDVFSERVRLSTWEKLGVLGKGWMRRLL